jgi:hypothetical protein
MLSLDDFNISPDGRVVVFQFSRGPGMSTGLGLYEWQTEKVSHIPNPPGGALSGASFSYDGRVLAATLFVHSKTECSIVIIDLDSGKVTQITEGRRLPAYVVYPIFVPGAGRQRILFCAKPTIGFTGLQLVDISGHREETVLPESEGFLRIYRPSFVSDNKVYFRAISPLIKILQSELSAAGLAANGDEFSFSLDLGKTPEVLLLNLESIKKSHPGYPGYAGSLSASGGGTKIITLGTNLDAPVNRIGEFNYEIFSVDRDGNPLQLTNRRAHLGYCRVSYDGSTACFGSKLSRNSPTELGIIDLTNNSVIMTRLRNQVEALPSFKGNM